MNRYLWVYRKQIILLLLAIALMVYSSLAKGNVAKITSIIAGCLMIYIGISFFIWIIRTPAKKSKEETVE